MARDASDARAHLVLVPNPPYHPNGDFALVDGRVALDGAPRHTYASIGVYDTALFRRTSARVAAQTSSVPPTMDSGRPGFRRDFRGCVGQCRLPRGLGAARCRAAQRTPAPTVVRCAKVRCRRCSPLGCSGPLRPASDLRARTFGNETHIRTTIGKHERYCPCPESAARFQQPASLRRDSPRARGAGDGKLDRRPRARSSPPSSPIPAPRRGIPWPSRSRERSIDSIVRGEPSIISTPSRARRNGARPITPRCPP